MVELVDETKQTAVKLVDGVEQGLSVVTQSLRDASVSALDLSEDASAALSNAAAEVVRVAESLRQNAVDTARDVARQAVQEVQEHPIASVAPAALTAIAAMVSVIVATRGKASSIK